MGCLKKLTKNSRSHNLNNFAHWLRLAAGFVEWPNNLGSGSVRLLAYNETPGGIKVEELPGNIGPVVLTYR